MNILQITTIAVLGVAMISCEKDNGAYSHAQSEFILKDWGLSKTLFRGGPWAPNDYSCVPRAENCFDEVLVKGAAGPVDTEYEEFLSALSSNRLPDYLNNNSGWKEFLPYLDRQTGTLEDLIAENSVMVETSTSDDHLRIFVVVPSRMADDFKLADVEVAFQIREE